MNHRIAVINGPNLNMLGVREPELYGSQSLDQINLELMKSIPDGVHLEFYQSNHEGDLVDYIQKLHQKIDLIIINAGALSHYSVSLHDALLAINVPVVEVHLTNIYRRESFRHKSLISDIALGGIFGFGSAGYQMAVSAAIEFLKKGN